MTDTAEVRVPKTDVELSELATRIYRGEVFTDRDIDPDEGPAMLGVVFLSLGLLGPSDRQALRDQGPVLLYEEMHKAGEMGVNGYPQFITFQWLCQDEMERLRGYLRELAGSGPE